MHTVGAGGGSIAWLDEGGALKVGPRVGGRRARPGRLRSRRRRAPTVTDANLVLGRLDPARFLGGAHDARRRRRARAVIGELAAELGKSVEAAAEDVLAVADAVMARALKSISVERGLDPRDFTLMPFGGAGAHARLRGRRASSA